MVRYEKYLGLFNYWEIEEGGVCCIKGENLEKVLGLEGKIVI